MGLSHENGLEFPGTITFIMKTFFTLQLLQHLTTRVVNFNLQFLFILMSKTPRILFMTDFTINDIYIYTASVC